MSKHTPGRWYTTQGRYVANDTVLIARVLTTGLSDEEVEANIYLIESAPKLLAACEAAVATLSSHGAIPTTHDIAVVRVLLNAAISEARGRA